MAGTDLGRLERALQIIAAASTRHGAALQELAPALPDLARMAGDSAGFATLIDVAIGLPSAVKVAAIAAMSCKNDPATAERVLIELGRWADSPERAATLDRFGTLGRVVTANGLVACVERVHAALAKLPESGDRRALIELLEHARTEPTLMRDVHARAAAVAQRPAARRVDSVHASSSRATTSRGRI